VKLRLGVSIELPIYAGETWKPLVEITNKLSVFHCRFVRTILGIAWHDHIRPTNEEVMSSTRMENLHVIIKKTVEICWLFPRHVTLNKLSGEWLIAVVSEQEWISSKKRASVSTDP